MPNRLGKTVLRLAAITCPLFGFFGATPVFALNAWDPLRLLLPFIFLTLFTFCLWAINFGIYVIWEKQGWQKYSAYRYLLSVLCCAALALILVFVVSRFQIMIPGDSVTAEIIKKRMIQSIYIMPFMQTQSMNVLIMVLLELIILRDLKQRVISENAQLKMASLEARHNQLKQQLHPHFLFNSLNTLRSLIKRSPEQAEDYLIRLSELLRASISNANQGLVTIYDELVMASNYLHMQQVRFGEAIIFSVPLDEASTTRQLVPIYSIQLLVENAIKHNILTQQQPLHISIDTDLKQNKVIIRNNYQPRKTMSDQSGIGLQNLTERYRLLVDKPLQISQTEEMFEVQIPLINPKEIPLT